MCKSSEMGELPHFFLIVGERIRRHVEADTRPRGNGNTAKKDLGRLYKDFDFHSE